MNRIIITAAALFVALIGNVQAQTNATQGKSAFKKVVKTQGAPTLSGLGSPANIQQSTTPRPALISQSLTTGYDPSTIKEVKYAQDQKHPVFFKSSKVVLINSTQNTEVQVAALRFLDANKPLLDIKNPATEFILKSAETDELGFTHVKMSQTFMGKTVWGKEIFLHFSPNGTTVNGRWAATPALSAPANVISAQSAVNIVVADAKPATLNEAANNLLKYTGPTSQLIVFPKGLHNSADRWAYRIEVRTDFVNMYEYFVDAVSGQIIFKDNISCTTGPTTSNLTDLNGTSQTVNTYQNGSSYYMIDITRAMYNAGASTLPNSPVGALWTLDANYSDASNIQVQQITTTNNSSWPNSATAASASVNGATAYNYYHNTHGRNSIDGNGGTIISVINVNDNGQPMDNAFWNGQLMAYGNGNTYFKPLAGGVDVAGHEMTHGVIQATANLQYQDQSGALNESMADVFGVLIAGTNYTIGGSVVINTYFPSGVLRSLSDPHNGTTSGNNGWQPATMSEYVTGTADNGGVHTNSGIPNHAFYLFSTAVTKAKAEKVYYRALTKYLTSGSQFLDARLAVVQAASDLYGATEIQAAKNAFDAVEIFDGTPSHVTDTASVNGADWIIYQNTDLTKANTLYIIPPTSPTSANPVTSITALNRVSVTDDGSKSYFVDTNHNVQSVVVNTTSTCTVTPVSGLNTGEWDFVSVSRDGSKLALISKYADTAIYVYDFNYGLYKKYHLYAPTFSQGIVTNGPRYAGSVDWDPTSQYIIYDENNHFNSTDGSVLDYWDIGLMKVWDNSVDYFDSGQVSKLVNSLPDGISIGNPVYSKNHSEIVAFDLLTDSTGAFDAKGADLSTGNIGTMASGNSVANVPSFSGADDQITLTTQDTSSNMIIATTPLAPDIINGAGGVPTLVTNAEWSVWFRVGHRFGVGINDVATDNVKIYPVPASDKLIISMENNAGFNNVQITDLTGRVVLTQPISGSMAQLNVSALQSGVYIVRMKDETGSKNYTSKIVKN